MLVISNITDEQKREKHCDQKETYGAVFRVVSNLIFSTDFDNLELQVAIVFLCNELNVLFYFFFFDFTCDVLIEYLCIFPCSCLLFKGTVGAGRPNFRIKVSLI